MKRLALPLLLLIALLVGVIWLDEPAPDADLIIINRGDVFTLDPQRMTYLRDFRTSFALYEGLVRWNNEDYSIAPAAAASLPTVSDDGRAYMFILRDDAKWSNGDPVTAHDFVYSFRRALTPDSASYYTSHLFAIEGARAFFDWRVRALDERSEDGKRDAEALWEETKAQFAERVGVRALDDHTLVIELAEPVPQFLEILCLPIAMPVHRPTVEGWRLSSEQQNMVREYGWHATDPPMFGDRRWVRLNGTSGRLEHDLDWCKAGRLVSNGPYTLNRWRYKRDMHLVRNPHFHSPEMVRSDSILVQTIDDANTGVLAFETGDADWLAEVGAEYRADMLEQRLAYEERHRTRIDELLEQGFSLDEALALLPPPKRGERRNIHAFPTFGMDFYSFNCRPTLRDGRPNPFADPGVRRAFVKATDRETIVNHVTRLNERIVTTLVPQGAIPGYESPDGIGYDPDGAREELRKAGWFDRNGDGVLTNDEGRAFPVVEILWTTNTPRYRWISLELKSQWEQTLGVRVDLRGVETKFYREDLRRGNFMIARGTWYGDYGDPTTFLNLFHTDDGNNHRRYSSEYVDDLLAHAAEERNPRKRMDVLHEVERHIFQEDVPMLVICQLMQIYMYEPGELGGLSTHPRMVQYYWQLERTHTE